MSIDVGALIRKTDFEKTNIITGVSSIHQDEVIDHFLSEAYEKGYTYEATTLDAKDLIYDLRKIHSSIVHIYDEDQLFNMGLVALKKLSDKLKKEKFTFFTNIYEEYIAIVLFLKIGPDNINRDIYVAKKKIIENGDYDDLIGNDPLCSSMTFFNSGKEDFKQIVFLKNAQFIVDYNLQEAIDCFIDLETDNFKFNVITESDSLLRRKIRDYSDDVNVVELSKSAKKNTI